MYQNEPIAYFLFAISLYLVIRHSIEKNYIFLAISVLLWLIGGLFWKGIIYWGLTLIIYAPLTSIIVLPVIIYFWNEFFWFITTDKSIAFYTPFIGIIYLGVTLFFLFGLFKSSKKHILMWLFSIPYLVFVQRLYVIAIPAMLIITFNALKSLKIRTQTIEYTLIIFALFMAVFWGIHTFSEFPTESDMNLIKDANFCSRSVQNSFGVGYVLINQGFSVSSYGWPRHPDYNHIGCLIIENGIEDNNCIFIQKSSNLKLYKC